jgi:hypothetical protein
MRHILNVARLGTDTKWLTAVSHFRNRVSSMLIWNSTDPDGETGSSLGSSHLIDLSAWTRHSCSYSPGGLDLVLEGEGYPP